jgi:hypothetical protein
MSCLAKTASGALNRCEANWMKDVLMKHVASRCIAAIGAMVLTSCQGMGTAPREFDVSGKAIDVTTGKPLAGVFMVAIHQRAGGVAFAHSGIWCVKTVAQYTDAEGRFHFTYEEGRQPEFLFIKPGYYREYQLQYVDGIPQSWPRSIDYHKYDKNYRSPHQHVNVYLRPQDPSRPRFNYGDDTLCSRASSLEDVQPMIDFLKIKLDEYKEYAVNPVLIKNMQERIELQKELAIRPPQKK